MRILSWNCQGVGNTPTVRHLQEIQGQYLPEIIFLSETKNKRRYMESVAEKLGFHDLYTVEPIGRSGGLAVLWRDSCKIAIQQANRRLIDMKVEWQDKSFFLTGVYGDPVKSKRGLVWERLMRIGIKRAEPWLLTGDFNEMVDQDEKSGGVERTAEEGKEFRDMIHACGLRELKHLGYKLSWYGVRNEELVQCRLDRSLANSVWLDWFPHASAQYLRKICSDHSPVLTNLEGINWKRKTRFRYDQRWCKRQGFCEMVSRGWQEQEGGNLSFMSRIARCRKQISQWKRSAKPNSALRIREIQYKLYMATRQTGDDPGEISRLRSELNEEYLNEEVFWWQQCRLNWIRAGDRNTKYFHAVTKNRRAQNKIHSLVDDFEKEWFKEEDMGRVAETYFKLLFASEDVGVELEEWK